MSGAGHTSLRHSEAVERAELLAVRESVVELDLTETSEFTSRATIRFDCARPGASTFLDFKGVELASASLNGDRLDPSGWRNGRLPLEGLATENLVEVVGRMAYSSDGEGLHRHVDPADQQSYLYAMSFLDAAPRWFACFDQPDLKSRYDFRIRTPVDWTVLGNGPAESLGPGRWRIRPPHPLSTYFVTLVAGPYASVYAEHESAGLPIRLGLHVRASLGEHLAAEAEDLFAVTRACFDYYHRVFGVHYPFGEYHQAFVPDFNAGAMENPACVTFRDTFIYRARATEAERATRAGVVAHEMAHQWFGDLVTMRWWDDLWLNESFAEYMAHRCCTDATRYPLWTEFGILRKSWGSEVDQSPSSHPVAGNGSADAESALQDFDGISYAKGAALLRQLVAFLGEEVFLAGLRSYFSRHGYGNASLADLLAAWSDAGGEGLTEWAHAWLRSAGMDTISVERADRADRDGHEAAVVVVRRRPQGSSADRTHAIQVAGFDAAGAEVGRVAIRLAGAPQRIGLPASALVVPDAGDETWAKIRCGQWEGALGVLMGGRAEPTRVVLYNAIRDAVRNSELDPAVALQMICSAAPHETADVVVAATLRFARDSLAGPYAAQAQRSTRMATVQASARALLAAASPTSDRQLVAFRSAISTSVAVEELADWWAGRGLPGGLHLDPELNWAVVERLTSLGGHPEAIDAVLALDRSASAEVHAARARAGRPTREAKAAAWRLLTSPTGAGAYELYATAEAFFLPQQADLVRPYVERYFAEIPGTAAFRTGWVLGRVASLAYPLGVAVESDLALAQQTLGRSDLAAPIRRAVVDGTDELRRALRSRSRYG